MHFYKKVSVQKAEEWMDYILIVKVRLSDTMERDFHTIFVERIKQTRYRKDGMVDKEGNIKKIKNVAFELFERDWVRGTDACRKELDVIKNRAEANGWDFIPNYGDSDEVFCCIKRPYRFQIIVRPYASNIEIVWEHNVNVSHADVEDFRKTYHKRKDIDPNASLVDQYMGMITGETKGFSLVFLYSCSAAREASMLPSLIVE